MLLIYSNTTVVLEADPFTEEWSRSQYWINETATSDLLRYVTKWNFTVSQYQIFVDLEDDKRPIIVLSKGREMSIRKRHAAKLSKIIRKMPTMEFPLGGSRRMMTVKAARQILGFCQYKTFYYRRYNTAAAEIVLGIQIHLCIILWIPMSLLFAPFFFLIIMPMSVIECCFRCEFSLASRLGDLFFLVFCHLTGLRKDGGHFSCGWTECRVCYDEFGDQYPHRNSNPNHSSGGAGV